jgi:cytochrome oxidase assembly protein ShyY1
VQSVSSPALQALLSAGLSEPLFPWELRLAPDQPGGFRRDWPVVNVSPEKHRGYALQWFTMAAALLLLFVFRSSNLLSLVRGQSAGTNGKEY